jgi:hypothetical protein
LLADLLIAVATVPGRSPLRCGAGATGPQQMHGGARRPSASSSSQPMLMAGVWELCWTDPAISPGRVSGHSGGTCCCDWEVPLMVAANRLLIDPRDLLDPSLAGANPTPDLDRSLSMQPKDVHSWYPLDVEGVESSVVPGTGQPVCSVPRRSRVRVMEFGWPPMCPPCRSPRIAGLSEARRVNTDRRLGLLQPQAYFR